MFGNSWLKILPPLPKVSTISRLERADSKFDITGEVFIFLIWVDTSHPSISFSDGFISILVGRGDVLDLVYPHSSDEKVIGHVTTFN